MEYTVFCNRKGQIRIRPSNLSSGNFHNLGITGGLDYCNRAIKALADYGIQDQEYYVARMSEAMNKYHRRAIIENFYKRGQIWMGNNPE